MGKNKKILKELRKLNRTQSRIEKLLIAEARESNKVKHYHINTQPSTENESEKEKEKKEKKYGKYEYSESELKADWNKI